MPEAWSADLRRQIKERYSATVRGAPFVSLASLVTDMARAFPNGIVSSGCKLLTPSEEVATWRV